MYRQSKLSLYKPFLKIKYQYSSLFQIIACRPTERGSFSFIRRKSQTLACTTLYWYCVHTMQSDTITLLWHQCRYISWLRGCLSQWHWLPVDRHYRSQARSFHVQGNIIIYFLFYKLYRLPTLHLTDIIWHCTTNFTKNSVKHQCIFKADFVNF